MLEGYNVYYNEDCIASYYKDEEKNEYSYYVSYPSLFKGKVPDKYLHSFVDREKPAAFLEEIMTEEYRVQGTRKLIYRKNNLNIIRQPKDTDCFMVYNKQTSKNDENHSAPHYEGPGTPEGMKEWASYYQFVRRDDNTFEVQLEENWWWGGGHNDGGTIHMEIPEEYFNLSYDEFLEKVVTIGRAAHYGFDADYLRNKEGLREFFGF